MRRPGLAARLGARLATIGRLIVHFTRRRRLVLLPLLIVLLLAGILLLLTGGLSYVAPFVYSIF